jgi:hypothetical protein
LAYDPLLDARRIITGVSSGTPKYTTFDYTTADSTLDTVILAEGGSIGTVFEDAAVIDVNTHSVKVLGDYDGIDAYVGRSYAEEVELSRPVLRNQNGEALLDPQIKLHRLRLNHSDSGGYSVEITLPGRAAREVTWTPVSGGIEAEGDSNFWVQGHANDAKIVIKNDSPYPSHIACGEYEVTATERSS